jgi:energy-coupling factor transport system ATP-binding protein
MAYLEIKDVSFTYPNGNEALQHVSFDLEMGEKVAIIGQNGAGKTTLVKLMNGLLKPTKGQILVDGKDTKFLTAAKISRYVSYSFQNPDDQIFNKDVYSEIAYGLKRRKIDAKLLERSVQEAAKICKIGKLLDENPYDLSLPIRKFVAIASVIVINAGVVILDEPTAGQDKMGMECVSDIIEYLSSQGKTVIVITHDMEFVANNFERCIVMAQKRKIADNNTKAIFWNEELLFESKLRRPYISDLCIKLGLEKEILTIDQFISYMETRQRER